MNDKESAPEPDYRARGQYKGDTAASYDADRNRTTYDRAKWSRERDRLTTQLRTVAPRGRILDIPTGTGRLLEAIGSVAGEVVGADISQDMLELAAGAPGGRIPLLRSEAERLPFPDDSFDVVVSIRFFQHLPQESIIPILTEMIRVSTHGALIQAPITKLTSSAIKAGVDAWRFVSHRGSGPRPPLRAPRPRDRYFPVPAADFTSLLHANGLRLESSRFVTWPGGQLTLMHVVAT